MGNIFTVDSIGELLLRQGSVVCGQTAAFWQPTSTHLWSWILVSWTPICPLNDGADDLFVSVGKTWLLSTSTNSNLRAMNASDDQGGQLIRLAQHLKPPFHGHGSSLLPSFRPWRLESMRTYFFVDIHSVSVRAPTKCF